MRTHRLPPPRMLTGLLTALLLVAAPVACRKHAKPSEAYTQAYMRFGKLYAKEGDDAFLAPEMAQVESLLGQVPADSMDAPAADELRARIQAGKQQAQARQKAKAEALAKAREQSQMPSGFGSTPSPAPSASEQHEEPTDAGTDAGMASMPGVGTPVSQLASGFSGCFQQGEPLEVKGRGQRDRWELQDRPACRQQYGSLQEQVLIVEDGKVLTLVPKSAIRVLPVEGGTDGSPSDGGR